MSEFFSPEIFRDDNYDNKSKSKEMIPENNVHSEEVDPSEIFRDDDNDDNKSKSKEIIPENDVPSQEVDPSVLFTFLVFLTPPDYDTDDLLTKVKVVMSYDEDRKIKSKKIFNQLRMMSKLTSSAVTKPPTKLDITKWIVSNSGEGKDIIKKMQYNKIAAFVNISKLNNVFVIHSITLAYTIAGSQNKTIRETFKFGALTESNKDDYRNTLLNEMKTFVYRAATDLDPKDIWQKIRNHGNSTVRGGGRSSRRKRHVSNSNSSQSSKRRRITLNLKI